MATLAQDSVIDRIRSHFPALSSKTVFFENAGGSQVPQHVIDRVSRYFAESYVNYGAAYPESESATRTIKDAHRLVNRMMGGEETGGVVFGGSSSQVLRMLADCYLDILHPGDEIVIAESGHEANINPWVRLEKFGIKIVWWKVDPEARQCTIDGLKACLTDKTRLVCYPHVSNLLGEVVDVKAINDIVHHAGAEVVVDGVAYAPHDLVDVQAWDCDWYAYSTYKVFGPHMGALYGKNKCWQKLTGPNHFFIAKDIFPAKFELGAMNHEGCAAILGLGDYMLDMLGEPGHGEFITRDQIERAWKLFNRVEAPLTTRILDWFASKHQWDVVGPRSTGHGRIGIISFRHSSVSAMEITGAMHHAGIGCRAGHMYSYRLCEGLGIPPEEGVIRVSFCHYNTLAEVDALIRVLEQF